MITTQSKSVWKTYAIWAVWVGVTFFSIYPSCNWLTSHRTDYFNLYIASELSFPFVPEFMLAYLSMYILFAMPPLFLGVVELTALGKQLIFGTLISGLIFLFLPTKLRFIRSVPQDGFYGPLYSNLFSLDMPHNMVPSLHVVFSALILFAIAATMRTMAQKLFWYGWLVLICASTLFVHQHHLLDVITGLAIAGLLRKVILKREQYD